MATQHVKRNLLLNLYREGKTYHWFVSSCCLRVIKMSGTCSLFNPFGDPWPCCLLPSYYHTFALISHVSKAMLKIRQTRFQQYVNWQLSDVQAGFRKGRGTRVQIASIHWLPPALLTAAQASLRSLTTPTTDTPETNFLFHSPACFY